MSNFYTSKIIFLLFFWFSFNSIASQGQLAFTLSKAAQSNQISSWSLVFPNHLVESTSQLSLLNSEGETIKAAFKQILLWPNQGKKTFLRAIQITTNTQIKKSSYLLKWQRNSESNIDLAHTFKINTHHANLTANWLSQSYYAPMIAANAYEPFIWFDNANLHYANFIISPALMKKRKLSLKKASPWLYDRVLSLYILYFKTGDLYWKIKAHDAAINYKNNIDNNGDFYLKPNDMKYSNTQGLLFDFLFYPNEGTLNTISLLYNKTTIWDTKIKTQGFWTERHHSTALAAAITYWALFNDRKALNRVKSFHKNMLKKLKDDVCLSHPYKSHEGKKINTNVCSPWMSALIVEQLWRFHYLSYSFESIIIIKKLSDFFAHEGLFHFTYGKEYSAVPKYLANLNHTIKENNNPWSDLNHACDVATALAKGVYLNQFASADKPKTLTSLNQMLKTCYRSMHRTNPNNAWPIVPLRKFNWWYTSTGSFTWLMKELQMKHPQK